MSKTVVRFQDCDAFGHLNNASFITYFINAREDHLRDYYAFDLYEHARLSNENWFVGRHEIAYLRPAALGETVSIQTGLLHFSNRSLVVEGVMFDKDANKIKAVQWTTFRYVNLQQGRAAEHPEAINTLLAGVLLEDVERESLDRRIRQLKKAGNAA
ncbi:MAG: acyl-CoA thioesterase [Bacteroidota bacterium]